MITKEKREIKGITKDKVEKSQAFKLGKAEYKDKDKMDIDVNVKTGLDFALVHDGVTAFAVIEGTEKGVTETIHTIEEFKDIQGCIDRIEELELEWSTGIFPEVAANG